MLQTLRIMYALPWNPLSESAPHKPLPPDQNLGWLGTCLENVHIKGDACDYETRNLFTALNG